MEGTISPIKLKPYDRDDLSCTLLKSIRNFYSDPANVIRFEKWKKEKEEIKSESNQKSNNEIRSL